MNWSVDWSLIGPGLLAGMLVLATHVPLGLRVLAKGIIFIDLAIAQVAVLGAVIGHAFLPEDAVPFAAGAGALLAAIVFAWLEKMSVRHLEALIGVIYVLAATSGMVMVAHDPHGAEVWRDMSAGQVLWVTPAQLHGMVWVTLIAGAAIWLFRERGVLLGFYLPFALVITSAVGQVGVFLVFASLIIPALAVSGMERFRLPLAWLTGALGMFLGMLISLWLDWPTGPAMVLLMAGTAAAVALLRRLIRF